MMPASPARALPVHVPREFRRPGAGAAGPDMPMKAILLMLLFFTSAAARESLLRNGSDTRRPRP